MSSLWSSNNILRAYAFVENLREQKNVFLLFFFSGIFCLSLLQCCFFRRFSKNVGVKRYELENCYVSSSVSYCSLKSFNSFLKRFAWMFKHAIKVNVMMYYQNIWWIIEISLPVKQNTQNVTKLSLSQLICFALR